MKKLFLLFGMLCTAILFSSCGKDDSNLAPEISSVKIEPAEVNAGGYVKISVNATDPENELITYSFSVTGGEVDEEGSAGYWKTPSSAGTYTVTVEAKDEKGEISTKTATITVLEPVTQVSGYASLESGASGNMEGAIAYLQTTSGSFVKKVTSAGSGRSVVFNITGIDPGSYHLILWKDTDNSGDSNAGDYFGWYGSGGVLGPDFHTFEVATAQTFTCNLTVYHPL
jgi:major membrane immunogen (membrane-anchored lipoprotein)